MSKKSRRKRQKNWQVVLMIYPSNGRLYGPSSERHEVRWRSIIKETAMKRAFALAMDKLHSTKLKHPRILSLTGRGYVTWMKSVVTIIRLKQKYFTAEDLKNHVGPRRNAFRTLSPLG